MKIKLNRTYTTIAVYALFVIAFALILGVIVLNMSSVFGIIGTLLDKLGSLFFGLFFTFCLLPPVRFFERCFSRNINKTKQHKVLVPLLATLLVFLIFVSIIVIAVAGIVPAIISGYNAFRESVVPQIEDMTARVDASTSVIFKRIYHLVYDLFANLLAPESGSLISTITTYATNVFSKAYEVVVGLILAAYFLVCRRYLSTISNKFFTAFLPTNFRNATFAVVKRIYNFFMEFFSYRLLSGFVLALLTYLLCIPFRVPYGIIIAVLVFVANFVPVFGPIVATLASTLLIAIFSPSEARLWQSLAILIILASLHILSAVLVEPFFLRKKLRPGPGVVVTSVIVSYAIFGFGGIIFAVPLYTSVDVAYREILARLLARKNLPLNNAYYLELNELPVPEKTPARKMPDGPDDDDDEDSGYDDDISDDRVPEEAQPGDYVYLTMPVETESDSPVEPADSETPIVVPQPDTPVNPSPTEDEGVSPNTLPQTAHNAAPKKARRHRDEKDGK